MKLSEFDLDWYGRWPIRHRALDEWSRPGLTNFLGSLQVSGDPTSIRHIVFPPVSSAEENTAFLTINDTFVCATLTETEVEWRPWSVIRRCEIDGWAVESELVMVPGEHAVVQRTTITSRREVHETVRVGMRLSGRCVNRGLERWWWGIPYVQLTLADLHEHGGLDPLVTMIRDCGKLFQERSQGGHASHFAGQAFNAQVLEPAPHEWRRNGDAGYSFDLEPGGSASFTLGVALADTDAAADLAMRVVKDHGQAVALAKQQWQELWQSAFRSGGPLGGQLPNLELPERVAPVAASAILSALQCRRTHRANGGKTFYIISTPRRVEACFYTNDWAMAVPLLAKMDPEATWRQFEMALKADVRAHNQINTFTGVGAKLNTPFSPPEDGGADWPYTIDVFNLFHTGWILWKNQGADRAMLDRVFDAPSGPVTLLAFFEDFAFDWRRRKNSDFGLADYGPKEHLLECVSTYSHMVAAPNACAVWMLRRMAEIYRLLGRADHAADVEAEADGLAQRMLEHLYVPGAGYFKALQPDGRAHEVRHCWDTGMVLSYMGRELPRNVAEEIVRFFETELRTPGWLRALSPQDADAATSGLRADHQFNGAFGSWPAYVANGLMEVGRHDLVGPWLEGISRTARQGPFGQAHYDEGSFPATHGGATKVTDEIPQGCHWANISGALLFDTATRWAAFNSGNLHPPKSLQ